MSDSSIRLPVTYVECSCFSVCRSGFMFQKSCLWGRGAMGVGEGQSCVIWLRLWLALAPLCPPRKHDAGARGNSSSQRSCPQSCVNTSLTLWEQAVNTEHGNPALWSRLPQSAHLNAQFYGLPMFRSVAFVQCIH